MKSALLYIYFVLSLINCHVHSFFFSKPTTNTNNNDPLAVIEPLTTLTGVPAHLVQKYSSQSFTCDNNSKTISSTEINDEFCDCVDGKFVYSLRFDI